MEILLSNLFAQLAEAQKYNHQQSTELTKTITSCLRLFIFYMVDNKNFIIAPNYMADINDKDNSDDKNIIVIGQCVNDKEEKENILIKVDIPFAIRPRHEHLRTDLFTLSEDELLKVITLNIFEPQPFCDGTYKNIFLSLGQSHYNARQGSFDYKKKRTKVLALNKATTPGINYIIPLHKQNDVRAMLTNKQDYRGIYFPYNSNYAAGMITPYFDGENLYNYFMVAKNDIAAGTYTLKQLEFQFKVIIINLFKELAKLHHKKLIHRDVKMENIIIIEKFDEQNNPLGVEIHLIDPDLIVSNHEKIDGIRGTLIVIPQQTFDIFQQSGTATPYQDIYGALICSATLLQPELYVGFELLAQKFLDAFYSQNGQASFYLNSIKNYFINILQNSDNSFLTNNILPGFKDPTITSFQILVNMINSDNSMAKFVTEEVETVKENQDYIQHYYGKNLFTEERKNGSFYLAECFIGIKNFSFEELRKSLNPDKDTGVKRNRDSEEPVPQKRKTPMFYMAHNETLVQYGSFFSHDDLLVREKEMITPPISLTF